MMMMMIILIIIIIIQKILITIMMMYHYSLKIILSHPHLLAMIVLARRRGMRKTSWSEMNR